MRRVGAGERRARLGVRHHLARSARAEGPVEVARDLVALHGTDPASVFLAAAARMTAPDAAAIERALYEDRSLVRMLGMRRTVFVVPVGFAPVVQAACTRTIAERERRRTVGFLASSGVADDPGAWFAEVQDATLRALEARGEATATELSSDEPRLRQEILLGAGTSSEARQRIVTRVLSQLAADGRIARARPRGSWTSSQFRWAPIEAWLPGGMGDQSPQRAQAELVRAWLARFGPATAADVKWWTGLTVTEVRRALSEVGPAEVDLDGATGLVLADDLEPVPAPEPWVALLPGLDPTAMGWQERAWYLGAHAPALFDATGNIGPTVWSDGRIVGGWAQRRDGEVAFRLLEDVGADALAAVTAEAERLTGWLGATRVTPRFRTPLERELVG